MEDQQGTLAIGGKTAYCEPDSYRENELRSLRFSTCRIRNLASLKTSTFI